MAYDKFVLAKSGSMVGPLSLFTEFKENWQYFFNEPTMTPASPGSVDKIVNVRSFTRHRGPGDPGYTVRSTARHYARSAKSKGAARPGNTYVIAERDPLGFGYVQKRQFAILGNDMDVLAYAKAKAKFQIVIWSPNGWSKTIPGVSGGTLAVPQGGVVAP